MQIVCPNCSASFNVAANAVGPAGRSVRCAKCRHVWTVRAPANQAVAPPALIPAPPPAVTAADSLIPRPGSTPTEAARAQAPDIGWDVNAAPGAEQDAAPVQEAVAEAASVAEPPSEDDAMSEQEAEVAEEAVASAYAEALGPPQIDDAPDLAPQDEPHDQDAALAEAEEAEVVEAQAAASPQTPDYYEVRRRATLAALRKKRDRPKVSAARAAAALVGLVFALCYARENVVRIAPQVASLYAFVGMPVNLRGLVFEDIKTAASTQEGMPVLLVEGSIKNIAAVPVEVPRLRFALRNAAGAEVYSWTALSDRGVLPPGEAMPFQTRLASPPTDGREVFVRFFNVRDYASAIR